MNKLGKNSQLSRRTLLSAGAGLSLAALLRPTRVDAAGSPYVSEIAPGVFVHQGIHAMPAAGNQGNISNATIIIGDSAVAVVDTGGSAIVGKQLFDAVRTLTDRPVKYVINTHMHPDHVFGNVAFKGGQIEFVAHHKMARGLAARTESYMTSYKNQLGEDAFKGIEIVMPTKGVDTVATLDLGGRTLELSPQKTAHTDNDLIVRDVKTDTLVLGDLLFAGHIPTIDGSLRGWINVMDDLSKSKAARVVPGHGPPSLSWPEGADPLRHYLTTLASDVRGMLKQGKTISDAMTSAGQSEKASWVLFDEYNARNASTAFAELEWE